MTSTIKVDTISENTSANGVAVDGVTLKDGGIAATLASTITTADNTDTLSLISTDTDDNSGPNLRMYRNSGSPGDNYVIGQIQFEGKNDAAQDVVYNDISMKIQDASDGTEDGIIRFRNMQNGTLRQYLSTSGTETVFNADSVDLAFRVESDNSTKAFFVSGTKGNCHITGASSATKLSYYSSGIGNLQLGLGGALHSYDYSAIDGPYLSNNQYIDNGTRKNIATGKTARYGMYDGRHLFSTSASESANATTTLVERMEIKNNGDVEIGSFTTDGSGTGVSFEVGGSSAPEIYSSAQGTATRVHYQFYNDNGVVGKITTNGTATSFTTSSDYRLKENVITDWDATTRLKQLKPSRFNFKADADTTVDGFLAHEVSSIVPEAISGNKDATETKTNVVVNAKGQVIAEEITEADWTAGKVADEDGNIIYPTDSTWAASKVVPVYQGIDQSKLVPLLVKTIQELEARITTLEG